jgi:hypothetical protein
MKTIIKIPHNLFEQAKNDLLRPSKVSWERVGFFSTKCSKRGDTLLVHCVAYNSVQDDHYIIDNTVGVRIGSKAITEAMARAINDSVGQIHVHYHGGNGLPYPSGTDSEELPPLAISLRNANSAEAHGWMILGNNDAWTSILLPENGDVVIEAPVSIVGFPTVINRRVKTVFPSKILWHKHGKRTKPKDRYDRQSFLGADSETIIAQSNIGVIGLGGGGSHIVQQLAHLGFNNFVLSDDDIITESNLNRLVGGTLADVRAKTLKITIAERIIRNLHVDACILGHAKKWEEATQDLMACDLIVGCVDKFSARRDLEAFCRRHMIPYVDIGMDVQKISSGYEIYGQIILSMPGEPCMTCMGFLNEKVLREEAEAYGAAGDKPQVVWSNGILASTAVGLVVDLLTDWSKKTRGPVYQTFRGSTFLLELDKRLPLCQNMRCGHFPFQQMGSPQYTSL